MGRLEPGLTRPCKIQLEKGKAFTHFKQVCDMIKFISENSICLHYEKQAGVGSRVDGKSLLRIYYMSPSKKEKAFCIRAIIVKVEEKSRH